MSFDMLFTFLQSLFLLKVYYFNLVNILPLLLTFFIFHVHEFFLDFFLFCLIPLPIPYP